MIAILVAAYILCFLIIIFIAYVLLRSMLFGAIYFPTTGNGVKTIRTLAHVKPHDKIADLGSGDGRILIALAREGAEAHGYEIDPFLVLRSRRAISKAGLKGKALVHWKSFWKADLSSYDTVIAYGFPHIMKPLGEKLKRELAPGAKVISNVFIFSNLTEVGSENNVRLYRIPSMSPQDVGRASL